ncbi:MaoC family dehydratase N-terminal domain-containing protein [Rhodococcus sp. NPDC057529]|uniref:FAS1-like dehydratase domain-containing protein n=1 Tax=Rhodococcus sp. NPDC057529 TaxID=3346158 RepID=UPI003672AA89
MLLNPNLPGRVFPPVGSYLVGRGKVREFTHSVFTTNPIRINPVAVRAAGHADVVTPPTFAAVMVEPAVGQLFRNPDTGLDPGRVVHGSQSVVYHRDIVAGDELTTDLTIASVTERGTHVIITTSSGIRDSHGHPLSVSAFRACAACRVLAQGT